MRCRVEFSCNDIGVIPKRCASCADEYRLRRAKEYKRLLRQDPVRWERAKRLSREWRSVLYAEALAVGDVLLTDVARHPRKYLKRIAKKQGKFK